MQLTLTILGIILFQIALVLLQWLFFKRNEFLWYIIYLLTIFFYLYIYNEEQLGLTNIFYPNYYIQSNCLRIIGFFTLATYVIFGRIFIDLKQLYPEMMPIVNRLMNTIWVCTAFYILATFFTNNLIYLENISFSIYAVIFIYSSIMNLILIKKNITLNNFIIVGSIFAIVGGSIQGILETINIRKGAPMFVDVQTLGIGCVIEFICLNMGFLYKSKMIQNEEIAAKERVIQLLKEKEEISHRLQGIQKEYSMDLHDEIGSTLSSILIYNQLVQQSIDVDHVKTKSFSQKISESVDEIMSITDEIIWGLKSKANNGSSFVQRLESYANTFLLTKNIKWDFNVEASISHALNNTVLERNVLLIIKEALNNCGKYSESKTVSLKMYIHNAVLTIHIKDDGKGSNQVKSLGGNGINNMRHRCEKMGGEFSFESIPNNGTSIRCEIPIATFS